MRPTIVFATNLIILVMFGVRVSACNYAPAYAEYGRAAAAYSSGDYAKAFSGALAAADAIKVCLRTDDPKQSISQENKALWASYLVAAADAGSRMTSYPSKPTRSELQGLVKIAIRAEEEVLASPYAAKLSKTTIRSDLPKFRTFLAGL